MIELSLPEFYQLQKTYKLLVDDLSSTFIEGRKIAKVFGCFPNMCWNGGNLKISNRTVPIDEAESCLRIFLNRGIRISLVASNCLLDENPSLIDDDYCIQIIDMMKRLYEEFKTQLSEPFSCNIVSQKLADFLRARFPEMRLCWSNLSEQSKTDDPNSIKEDIILDESRNHDIEFLKKIKNKDKIEFLATSCCKANCQFKDEHSRIISKAQIDRQKITTFNDCLMESKASQFLDCKTMLSEQDVDELVDLGFSRFKITSRKIDDKWDFKFTCNNIVNWLVRKPFRKIVLGKMLGEGMIEL